MGKLIVFTGPMFSAKSTALQQQVRRLTLAGKKCLIVKHNSDVRYGNPTNCCTHDLQTMSAVPTKCLWDVIDQCNEVDVVAIDEGQFFPEIVEFANELVENRGKIVIIAALDGTYEGKHFGRIADLVPYCEQFTKLSAVCNDCGNDAAFTVRRKDFTGHENVVEVVGASDLYESLCRSCRAKRGYKFK